MSADAFPIGRFLVGTPLRADTRSVVADRRYSTIADDKQFRPQQLSSTIQSHAVVGEI